VRHASATLLAALLVLSCGKKAPSPAVEAEIHARESFARAVSAEAGMGKRWNVSSSNDVSYEEGFSLLLHDPPDDLRGSAFRWMGQTGHVKLRRHPGEAMHLKVVGWCHVKEMRTRPVVSLYVDGRLLRTSGAVDEGGAWYFEETIPPGDLPATDWVDLTIAVSAVGYHWSEPPELRVVALNLLTWTVAR
jgi:hypothetical protein